MSTKTDELMRLAWDLAEANARKSAPGVLSMFDPTHAPAERLRDAIQEVVKDAERYGWLRSVGGRSWTRLDVKTLDVNEYYDLAVDLFSAEQ